MIDKTKAFWTGESAGDIEEYLKAYGIPAQIAVLARRTTFTPPTCIFVRGIVIP